MNELKEREIFSAFYTFVSGYVDVHKEGTGHLYPFLGEERGKKLWRSDY